MIGNIVIEDEFNLDDFFNVYKNYDDVNNDLPTIIVGHELVKKYFNNIDYIDRKIKEDLFWTFSRDEKIDLFHDDIYEFINYCYLKLKTKYKYVFVDLILYDEKIISKIFNLIYKSNNIVSIYDNNNIFLNCDKYIFGFDLNLFSYCGYDSDKLISKIKSISNEFFKIDDIIIKYENNINMLGNDIKYITVLHRLKYNNYG